MRNPTFIFVYFQGIALRGHGDDGVIDPTEDYFVRRTHKFGNFNAVLQLQCICGDQKLVDHLVSSDKNAKYCSHDMVDEMVKEARILIERRII